MESFQGKADSMFQFYTLKVLIILSLLLIATAQLGRQRRPGGKLPAVLKAAPMFLVCAWLLVDWLLFDPFVGVMRGGTMDRSFMTSSAMMTFAIIQSWVFPLCFVSLGLGEAMTGMARRKDAAVEDPPACVSSKVDPPGP